LRILEKKRSGISVFRITALQLYLSVFTIYTPVNANLINEDRKSTIKNLKLF